MKKTVLLIVGIVVAVALFIGVYFLYGALKDSYAPDLFSPPDVHETQEETDNADGTSDEIGEDEPSEPEDFKAPDFTVLNEEGEEVKLSDYFGKPIVLNFWATWCYYCKEEMPDFNRAYKEHPEVQFLMVNATDGVRETVEKAETYIDEQGFEFPVVYDTTQQAVYTYYVTGFPCTYFIDKDGNLVTYANGMLSYDNLVKGIGFITQ